MVESFVVGDVVEETVIIYDSRNNIEVGTLTRRMNEAAEVEFIFNRLTSISMVDFAALPVDIRQAYINKLVAFRDRINALASDKVKEFNIHTNMR